MEETPGSGSLTADPDTRPQVYVYGGGVAGMTAAHELAIRGFKVCLYEKEQALGPHGLDEDVTLGGMARTQYFATTKQQRLYFRTHTRARNIERLRELNQEDLRDFLIRAETPLLRFGEELLQAHAANHGEAVTNALRGAFGNALDPPLLRQFVDALRKLVSDRPDFKKLHDELGEPGFIEPKLDTLSSQLERSWTEGADRAEKEQRKQVLLEAFAKAMIETHDGSVAVNLLKGQAGYQRAETLPPALTKAFDDALDAGLTLRASPALLLQAFDESSSTKIFNLAALTRNVVGQGPEASRYAPEFWFEFNSRYKPALTTSSVERIARACNAINYYDRWRYFDTGLGFPSDVRILVQGFSESGLSRRKSLQRTPAGAASAYPEQEAAHRSDTVLSLFKERLKEPLSQQVELYRGPGGRFLNASAGLGLAPVARNWVRVLVYRPQLPGEHGYRFFPSYYRHVFDTMSRIPLQDDNGQPMGGTVLDNLRDLPQIGIFSERHAPFLMSWNAAPAGEVFSRSDYHQRKFADLQLQSRDLLQFSLRILRYLTSCSRRRAAELEDTSWWSYLEGYDAKTGSRMYRYSDAFKQLVTSSSRVLAALDGEHGDARTCGNTYVQLLTQALVPTARNNCTLNGPTSEAWFSHWRTHLERLGVEFEQGELQKLTLRDGKLVAQVQCKHQTGFVVHGDAEPVPVYFVVATDLLTAAEVTKELKGEFFTRLQGFAQRTPQEASPQKQQGFAQGQSQNDKAPRNARDRLQTISGIQFFFEKPVNIVDGYIYCVDAEWRLSAICSHIVWQEPPVGTLSAYQSVLSVDIGDWNTPSSDLGLAASQCSPAQLKEEVLRQLRVALSARGPNEPAATFVLPEPDWVHIDESLEYEGFASDPHTPVDANRPLRSNQAPYLIPVVGDWKNRPGPEPWDPTPQTQPPPPWVPGTGAWQAPHGGYPVHHGRLVFAGTWVKTFTRMTTMESANESARHAVNAILDHIPPPATLGAPTPTVWHPAQPGGPMNANPYEKGLFPTTPRGDYCRIWNPEENELPDFELLQREDDENFRERRPHPMDALGMELLPSLLTHLPGSADAYDHLMRWVATNGTRAPAVTHGVLALLRQLRTMLEAARPPRRY